MVDSSREELAKSVFYHLGIKSDDWGDAVSQRPLRLLGESKPWDISVCTITNHSELERCFGPELKMTVACVLTVQCLVDVKAKVYEDVKMEVEVGVPFDYSHFRTIGGRGKILVTDNNRDGHIISVIMTENKKHYPYMDPDWQDAAAFYARQHVYDSLTAGLEATPKALVHVSVMSVSAFRPLDELVKRQSAKGLTAHLLVKGVAIAPEAGGDDDMSEDVVPAQPISLRANILDGGLSADGLSPSTSIGTIKLRCAGDYRTKGGLWYAPSLVSAERAATAAASKASGDSGAGSASRWSSRRTDRRAEQRATAASQARAERFGKGRATSADGSGDESDTSVRQRLSRVQFPGGGSAGGSSRPAPDLC